MVCFDRTKGWKEAGSLIVQGFFIPINYRGSAVEHPQISCHFSPPTIWGARNSVGRSAIPLVSVEINIFLCTFDDENVSRNITYRDQFSRVSTSNTVLWLQPSNARIPDTPAA